MSALGAAGWALAASVPGAAVGGLLARVGNVAQEVSDPTTAVPYVGGGMLAGVFALLAYIARAFAVGTIVSRNTAEAEKQHLKLIEDCNVRESKVADLLAKALEDSSAARKTQDRTNELLGQISAELRALANGGIKPRARPAKPRPRG